LDVLGRPLLSIPWDAIVIRWQIAPLIGAQKE